jgi:DNA-binding LytR/AlgR family response regulator
MNCMIVDDDEMSSQCLIHLMQKVEDLNLVNVCTSSLEAISRLEKGDIDLLFLDIEMPVMNGIELLKSLNKPPLVIFTTSHTQFAMEAYENNVLDYLVKPIALPKFLKSVEKAKTFLKQPAQKKDVFNRDYLFLKKNSILNKVHIKDLQWIEAMGDYVTINTQDARYTLHMTLKALEKKLPAGNFLRIHRSYIIQLDHITSIDDNMVCIGKKLIPVGALYREDFMMRLNLLT